MLNIYVALTLRELGSDLTTQGRRIRGHFQFLANDRMTAVGPEMMTEPYDWNDWLDWLSHDLEEQNLHQTGGLLHPGASAELGPVHLRMPNRTPFYLASDDNEGA
jgi:hypothetical protein